MDTALTLRIAFEKNSNIDENFAIDLLTKSKLVSKLTKDFDDNPLFVVFRLLGLSEIPFVEKLPYTQKLINYINKNIATTEGFSCLGGIEELVPCYNALIFEAYCRLGLANAKEAQAALNWIKNYQLFERDLKTSWNHKGICKHGGCLGSIPCYIGVGKTVRALITYLEFTNDTDVEIKDLVQQGIRYMLKHNMFQRLSNQKPISNHITDIMFPQNYALSLTDLAYIAGKQKLTMLPKCSALINLINSKQVSNNQWNIDYIYSYKGYVVFDTKNKISSWVSKLFPLWLL